MYIICVYLLQIVLQHGVDIETDTSLEMLTLYRYIDWITTDSCTPNKAECYDFMLTHCGLMMPYGDKDQGQHWLW